MKRSTRRAVVAMVSGTVMLALAPAALATHPEPVPAGACPADGHRSDTKVKQEQDTPIDGMPQHVADVGKAGVYADSGYAAVSMETRYIDVDANKPRVQYASDNPTWGAYIAADKQCVQIQGVGKK